MSFYIDSAERTCRTLVFARPTSNTTFSVDRRDFRRVGIWSLTRHHRKLLYILILHQTTTGRVCFFTDCALLYILILHQTTTNRLNNSLGAALLYILILHQTTTRCKLFRFLLLLLYILILHQTTTTNATGIFAFMLLYILILHQTTTGGNSCTMDSSCFISWFYIKPQLLNQNQWNIWVALYLDSTSNHNYAVVVNKDGSVALYLDSTSNHNLELHQSNRTVVASYFDSTSNHNNTAQR